MYFEQVKIQVHIRELENCMGHSYYNGDTVFQCRSVAELGRKDKSLDLGPNTSATNVSSTFHQEFKNQIETFVKVL